MEHSGLCLMNSEVRFFCKQGVRIYKRHFCVAKCLLGQPQTLCVLHPLDAGCAFVPNASITKKDHRGLFPKAGAILGGLCLSGLRFFLGSLFFGEKHLYILLCFHQFLHLIPCLAVGWISGFLLRKQCRVFRVQFFYLW